MVDLVNLEMSGFLMQKVNILLLLIVMIGLIAK